MRSIQDALRELEASFTYRQWEEYCGLTPRYPADLKPTRTGVYRTSRQLAGAAFSWTEGYAYWDGTQWSAQYTSFESAYRYRHHITPNTDQNKEWQGLAKEPKL